MVAAGRAFRQQVEAFGEACERWADAELSISAHRFDRLEMCRHLTINGWEHLEEARRAGRGVLVMSAHLGTWEMAAHVVGLYAEPMHVIGRPLDNPLLDRRLAEQRGRFGNVTIPKRGAARGALRVLGVHLGAAPE